MKTHRSQYSHSELEQAPMLCKLMHVNENLKQKLLKQINEINTAALLVDEAEYGAYILFKLLRFSQL